MEFLAHQIGGDVITLCRDNLENVQKTHDRQEASEILPRLIGLVGYYRDYVLAFTEISAPLSDFLKKGKSGQVQWNEARESAQEVPATRTSIEAS